MRSRLNTRIESRKVAEQLADDCKHAELRTTLNKQTLNKKGI